MPKPDNVGVGVACALFNYDGILLLQRKGAHAAGTWSIPGGWLDLEDSSMETAVIREVEEETGLVVSNPQQLYAVTELHTDGVEPLRTVTVYYAAYTPHALDARIMEPAKCSAMKWVDLWAHPQSSFPAVPRPLFPGLEAMLPRIRNHIDNHFGQ